MQGRSASDPCADPHHVAAPFGWTLARAAYAIVDIAVANMAGMVRLATTQRGLDPRDFTLLASGGAGPLHAAAVGEAIGAAEVVVPPHPGMFSALGATLACVRHEVARTLLRDLATCGDDVLADAFAELERRAGAILEAEPSGVAATAFDRVLEARFAGQLFELRLPLGRQGEPLPSAEQIERAFRERYASEYGFDLPEAKVQAVNVQLIASVDLGHRSDAIFEGEDEPSSDLQPSRYGTLLLRDGREEEMPIYRVASHRGGLVRGPAIIEHSGATVWIQDGQQACVQTGGQVTVALPGGRR